MLTVEQIANQYAERLRPFKRNILREYLQYKILEIIFTSVHAPKLSFLGGTALRIVYGNERFSEDLDFDNFGMSEEEFSDLADTVKDGMEKEGFSVEIDTVFKGAYRCRIKLPGILFGNNLSELKEEKILIQIDTVPHNFPYTPDRKILNKFDIFTAIAVTPVDIILSQKIYALLNRRRAKGRDFYDVIFLLSLTKPNYQYLKEKVSVENAEDARKKIIQFSKELNLQELADDVRPFLFDQGDVKKIELFTEFIEQASLE